MRRFNIGGHLKTAGTTRLEEHFGLAGSDGPGLAIAKEIYAEALARIGELCVQHPSFICFQYRQSQVAVT
jgi:hypothetical protein